MKKVVEVTIEEHLARTIQIEVPNELENENDREIYAFEKIHEMYKNGEIILDSDDYNGVTLCQIHDKETDTTCEWTDLI